MVHPSPSELDRLMGEALRKNDRNAFERVYDEFSAGVYGLCYKMLGDSRLAEDATVSIYLRLWLDAHKFKEHRVTLAVWVYSNARDYILETLRNQKIRRGLILESFIDREDDDEEYGVQLFDYDGIGIRFLEKNLPIEDSVLIMLIYYLGYSQDAAAMAIGIEPETVPSHLRRIMNRLRPILP